MAASGRGFWLRARVTRRDVGESVFTGRVAETLEMMKEENARLREELERLLAERQAEIAERQAELAEKQALSAEMQARVAEKQAQVAEKQAQVAEKQAQVETLVAHLKKKEQEIAKLEHRIDQLCRKIFGRSSEKVDPNQLRLAFAERDAERTELEAEKIEGLENVPDVESAPLHEKKRRGHGRRRLPEDLPRETIVHDLSAEEKKCRECGEELRLMKGAEDKRELFDYEPASYLVREHVCLKYSCEKCKANVVSAPLPPLPIVKGRPGAGLLAHVVTSKYCDHLPLNRLEGISKRHGVQIPRSTSCEWVGAVAFITQPIVAAVKRQVLAHPAIGTDDTPIRVLDDKHPKGSKQGHLWAYRGPPGAVVFDYTESRSGEGPRRFLEGYEGFVQADAFAGYDRLFESGKMIEVGCHAHARRKFRDALDSDPANAAVAIDGFRRLYRIEEEARERGLDHDARRRLRQEKSAPIHRALFEWLEKIAPETLPASALGEAVAYTLKLKTALSRYLDDGRLEIDNNAVERALRLVAVGRKNWLFAGSDNGGVRGAAIYSLVMSCKELDLDPFAYFRDVIERVSTTPASRVVELTPIGWKAARSS